ncbi:flagellar biosynthetic protein FliR [Granulosicoccus antarcticus]|uniref:Flagellar biosynthetic protein FliR n=1 Tax=Granulosicoccus antarcticus IMCC3135 TaxID=1192854 RepID=A0A2Z2NMP6_9GAMM|nr:flagellar biosynthetic protein FliR [Granulosicoccus antarcticus]ASJ71785.1 Flagellar biosynthetic protein FliR [Granulosicoccus antarcticus IMCC3135]
MSALSFSAEQINSYVGLIIWPLIRIAGAMSILPVLGGGEVPVRVRVGLAFILTIVVVPSLGPMPQVDPLSVDSIVISAQQLLIGVAMGLVVLIVFNAVTMAGETIAVTMGLGFAMLNDPQNGSQVPTVSQFYVIMATLLFLSLDGHHSIIMLINGSFTVLPIGQSLGEGALWLLVSWAAIIFKGALSIALPALTAMLTTNLVMGVITRAAPQLNLFSVGFPITMTVGFLSILLTLPTFQAAFESLLRMSQLTIVEFLRS